MESQNTHLEPIRRSANALVLRLFGLLFLVETVYALIIGAFLYFSPPSSYYPAFVVVIGVLHVIKYILVTTAVVKMVLTWVSTSYLISGSHLIKHEGTLRVDEKIYELNQLKAVDVHQDWIGRHFHYGNIKLAYLNPATTNW
jgi:membrane protein YdbS with pleckstrin-like domain